MAKLTKTANFEFSVSEMWLIRCSLKRYQTELMKSTYGKKAGVDFPQWQEQHLKEVTELLERLSKECVEKRMSLFSRD